MAAPVESIVDGSKATLRQLPSVDRLLREPAARALIEQHGHTLVADQCRQLLEELRRRVGTGVDAGELQDAELLAALQTRCQQALSSRFRCVINLTGTVIHTNLGRALLADQAIGQILAMMAAPNNLEFDLQSGARGERDSLVEPLLCQLTGAEAATVVNNNAGAVLLTLAALARGRPVIVSRGELVEIGGAFRMPDVMRAAGARLVEVGTTNATHLADYRRAIGERTALIMKVHTSNYAIEGFTSSVGERDLAVLARASNIRLACDLGSGSLVDLSNYGLPREPLPRDMIEAGCDVVMFSGDKLLGGPQAGIVVGRADLVATLAAHSLARAMRADKLTLAALQAVAFSYLSGDATTIPLWRMATAPLDGLRARAEAIAATIPAAKVVDTDAVAGGGSLPGLTIPSAGVGVEVPAPARALAHLREHDVVGRIDDDTVVCDLRTVDPADDERVGRALAAASA